MNDYTYRPTESGSRETIYTMAKNLEERQIKFASKTPKKFTQEEKDIFEAYLDRVCSANTKAFNAEKQTKQGKML